MLNYNFTIIFAQHCISHVSFYVVLHQLGQQLPPLPITWMLLDLAHLLLLEVPASRLSQDLSLVALSLPPPLPITWMLLDLIHLLLLEELASSLTLEILQALLPSRGLLLPSR